MNKLNEECGVFGIFCQSSEEVAKSVYYGLFALQHRGQESCGIVVNDDGLFTSHKDSGLVNDVFKEDVFRKLGRGNMAIGHVRYGTAGSGDRSNALPIVVNHIKGRMAISYNGKLVNAAALKEELELSGLIFHTSSDAEIISYLITRERLTAPSIEEAINRAVARLEGAFSFIVMSPSKMIAVRDSRAFHPICYGRTSNGSYVVASETCALDSVGAKVIRDIEPGEILIFEASGIRSIKDHCGKTPTSLCVFEHIYTARPDSIIDGEHVYAARHRAGEFLAEEHPVDADVVIGVPDSGIDAAIGYAHRSGIPYGIGFIKNKYIGRTFIQPTQKEREELVRIKLNTISDTVAGRRVIMVDDSIVRGTTSARIVRLLRDAGAKEVHMRVASPPFINPCYYGTDIQSKEALIACKHTLEEIKDIIGVDSLGYLSVENAKKIARCSPGIGFCTACFDGIYPTHPPIQTTANRFDKKISETKKENKTND